MKRSSLNFIIDLVGLVNLLALAFTGFIMKYILPPGTGGLALRRSLAEGGLGRQLHGGRGREHIEDFWSMTRHEWGSIHFYLAVLFIALIIVHLILHWSWIKSYIKSLFGLAQK